MGNTEQNIYSFYNYNNIYSPISTVAHSSINSFIQKMIMCAGALVSAGETGVSTVNMIPVSVTSNSQGGHGHGELRVGGCFLI